MVARAKNELKKLLDEARAAAALNHRHIVKVFEVGSDGRAHFFSMEFIPGGTVEERLAAGGRFEVEEALRIADEAASGLVYAAEKGLVHRDIKPGNLLLDLDGTVKICDLGIAGRIGPEEKETVRGGGSPYYIAPEQALGKPVDPRADIYSLGASLFTMLAGRPPFRGSSSREIARKHVTEPPPSLKGLRPDLPQPVCDLVDCMLRKKPEDRPQTAGEVRERIAKLLAERTPAPPKRGSWIPLAAAFAAIAVALILGTFFARQYLAHQAARKWQERVSQVRKQVSSLVDSGELEKARTTLREFLERNRRRTNLEWIPPTLSEIDRRLQARRAVERETRAEKELEAIKALADSESLEPLRRFLKRYPSTAAAREAAGILSRRTRRVQLRAEREKTAEREFRRLKKKSAAYAEAGNLRLAEEVWRTFPEDLLTTETGKNVAREREKIVKLARSRFEEARKAALAKAAEGDEPGALLVLGRLSLPEALRSSVEKAREEIRTAARRALEKRREKALREDRSALAEATRVVLPEGIVSGYGALRRAQHPGQLSTLEAVAHALAVLEGPQVAAALQGVFTRFVQAFVASRAERGVRGEDEARRNANP